MISWISGVTKIGPGNSHLNLLPILENLHCIKSSLPPTVQGEKDKCRLSQRPSRSGLGTCLAACQSQEDGQHRICFAEGGSCVRLLEAAVTVVSTVSPLNKFFGLILILMAWPLGFHDAVISGGPASDPSFLPLPDSLLK